MNHRNKDKSAYWWGAAFAAAALLLGLLVYTAGPSMNTASINTGRVPGAVR